MSDKIQTQLKKEFIEILTEINKVLLSGEHTGQATFINELKHLLVADKIDQFIEKANAVDMWGGAGSVWEVYFEVKERQRIFARAIKAFIDLMDRADIVENGAKSLKEFFTNYNN